MTDSLYTPSWSRRRKVLYFSLIGLFGALFFVLSPYSNVEVSKIAVTPLCLSIVALVGHYIFGAVWDDNNIMKNIKG